MPDPELTEIENTAKRYAVFADEEARGKSTLYEALARGVAEDTEILEFLLTLPSPKRQPNLLFAAVRYRHGIPADWAAFRRCLTSDFDGVRAVMLERVTQTNEPGRCAVLLPLLARMPQPLALLEVGASAGLCLLPDFYAYDYGDRRLPPRESSEAIPVLPCAAGAATPLPEQLPRIVWRAGLDLNPLDVADPEDTAWLETLVWPEQTERLDRLHKAVRIARTVKPTVVKGDLRTDLAIVAAEAPKDATLVVFHTSVLVYVADRDEREVFAREAQALCDHWIANESPRVFPDIAKTAGRRGGPGKFLLSDHGDPVAWTDPHGASMEWISSTSKRVA